MQDVKDLRDVVRQARLQAGMTQAELAEAVRMSQRWVSNVETGNVANPRTETLHRLAAVLPLTVEDLIIAAKLAKTRAGARRVAEAEPPPAEADSEQRQQLREIVNNVPAPLNCQRVRAQRTSRRSSGSRTITGP